MISVVIQGGAMRSIYCLGAVRAVVEGGFAAQVRTIHTASAGCVSGAVLATHVGGAGDRTVTEAVHLFLDSLGGDRFINLWRLRKVVDVDLLAETIDTITSLSARTLADRELTFEVGLTDAHDGSARYVDLAQSSSDQELYRALRATMAIPLLYPRKVMIDGRRYIDGGISDPLPVLRAMRRNPTAVIAISSVAKPYLGRELETPRESLVVRLLPNLSSSVKHLLLARNPLGAATEELTEWGSAAGIKVIRIAPADQALLGHRLETDRDRLLRLEEMGYQDGQRALAASAEAAESPQPST
ncbi:patatin-like phospholipase family protein [Plantactinospora sp. B5E13]|uniref:patatin-like phospholipase family protein n=1 Tax=unclassified Plantactinospora TaxID=2631981 RepID=UPI00325F73E0